MKRIIQMLFIFFAMWAVAVPAQAVPQLSLGSTTLSAGGNGWLELTLTGGEVPYAGVNAKLLLPAGISLAGVEKGGLLAAGDFMVDFCTFNGDEANTLTVIAYSAIDTFGPSDGVLLTLNLQVAGDAPTGTHDVNFASTNPDPLVNSRYALSNEDGSVSVAGIMVSSGSITILSPPIIIPTTPTTISTTTTTVDRTSSTSSSSSSTTSLTSTTSVVPLPECEITINPPSAKVLIGEKVQFIASTKCDNENESGTYEWSIESNNTGGSIDEESGLYTAGMIAGTDTIRVTDVANSNAADTAEVTCSLIWPLTYDKMWGDRKHENLLLLRVFRDEVLLKTEFGRGYISMLYDNSLEIGMLLLRDPSLALQTREVIDEILPDVESLLYEDEIKISRNTLEDFLSLLDDFETNASPKLKTAIKRVKKDIKEGSVLDQLGIIITE